MKSFIWERGISSFWMSRLMFLVSVSSLWCSDFWPCVM